MASNRPLDHYAEPIGATGGMVGEGVCAQLGRPRLDRLELLVREAVQNSWDACLSDAEPVRFGVSAWELDESQRRVFRRVVFAHEPPGIPLSRVRWVLAFQDLGTWGLSGPARADRPGSEPPPQNFIRFVWNIGQSSRTARAAGTYGFGKAAHYLASRYGTLVLHSHCRSGRGIKSRFLAAGIGDHFTERGRRYTGRRWWGRLSANGILRPVAGREADDLAASVGMSAFPTGTTGTTILILQPDLDGRGPEDCIEAIRDSAFRWFWPKLLDGRSGRPSMEFSFSWNGQEIKSFGTDRSRAAQAFASAFQRAQNAKPQDEALFRTVPIRSERPRCLLGQLSLVRFAAPVQAPVTGDEEDAVPADPLLTGNCHHVALMRSPHFVVRYVPCAPAPPMPYAGVFIADDRLDSSFAEAEPPAHDDWRHELLSHSHEKTFVRVALRRIREAVKEFTALPDSPSADALALPLGEFSDMLGGLMPSVEGEGARTPPGTRAGKRRGPRGGRPGGPRERPRVTILRDHLDARDGAPCLITDFSIENSGGKNVQVTADVGVVLEDGSLESDPPAGAGVPAVIYWQIAGQTIRDSDRCTVEQDGHYSLCVSLPRDAEVSLLLRADWEADV